MSYQIELTVDGRRIITLADILPDTSPIKLLIVGKAPAPVSVSEGHYFRGRQGAMFWNSLRKYGLLQVPGRRFEDEVLLEHGYAITDVVKVPHEFGKEPTDQEYKANWPRVAGLISRFHPRVIMFVYKRPLDQILRQVYARKTKASYGFNSDLEELFNSKVFVFPMPGTPCTTEEAQRAMTHLQRVLP